MPVPTLAPTYGAACRTGGGNCNQTSLDAFVTDDTNGVIKSTSTWTARASQLQVCLNIAAAHYAAFYLGGTWHLKFRQFESFGIAMEA